MEDEINLVDLDLIYIRWAVKKKHVHIRMPVARTRSNFRSEIKGPRFESGC